MVNFWQGETVSLAAGGVGTIRIRIAVNGTITHFLVNSTGRAKITDMQISGYEDFFEGTLELDQFKERGNVYELPDPIEVTRGSDLTVDLEDISGAANAVYFAVRITKA